MDDVEDVNDDDDDFDDRNLLRRLRRIDMLHGWLIIFQEYEEPVYSYSTLSR